MSASRPDLRDQLIAMQRRDQDVRAELVASGELFDDYHPAMRAVHDDHAAKLNAIVDEVGWPGRSLVGDDGTAAAWLVLVHSIAHPALLRRCRPLVAAAAANGENPRWHAAKLEDRIRCFEGRAQLYGTMFDWDPAGRMSPQRIENEGSVDERRSEVGLPPLQQDTERIRAEAAAEAHGPPPDYEAREAAKRRFARSVGWIPPRARRSGSGQ